MTVHHSNCPGLLLQSTETQAQCHKPETFVMCLKHLWWCLQGLLFFLTLKPDSLASPLSPTSQASLENLVIRLLDAEAWPPQPVVWTASVSEPLLDQEDNCLGSGRHKTGADEGNWSQNKDNPAAGPSTHLSSCVLSCSAAPCCWVPEVQQKKPKTKHELK